MSRFTCLVILLSLVTVVSSRADSTAVDTTAIATAVDTAAPSYILSIERKRAGWPLVEDTIDLYVESGEAAFAGFDLTVAPASDEYEITTVLSGDFIDECGWEFFNARDLLVEASDGRMLRSWKIIGLADVMPDSVEPACRNAVEQISLARLVITGRQTATTEPGELPVFFVWADCGDNSLSDVSGNQLFISRRVTNYLRPGRELSTDAFPNFSGAPRQCGSGDRIIRAVEFRSGGIVVEASVDTAGAK